MKSFPFIVCIVVGVWVGYYLGINKLADVASEGTKLAESETPVENNASAEISALKERIHDLESELAEFKSEQAKSDFDQRWKELENREYSKIDQQLIWAAEDVLDEEQLAALKQSLKEEQ